MANDGDLLDAILILETYNVRRADGTIQDSTKLSHPLTSVAIRNSLIVVFDDSLDEPISREADVVNKKNSRTTRSKVPTSISYVLSGTSRCCSSSRFPLEPVLSAEVSKRIPELPKL
jgi:hypothetical protein